jgi:hypothetical protein
MEQMDVMRGTFQKMHAEKKATCSEQVRKSSLHKSLMSFYESVKKFFYLLQQRRRFSIFQH